MRFPRPIRFFLIISLIGLHLAWYASLWAGYAVRVDLLRGADFKMIYTGGRLAATGQLGRVYDPQAQRQVQEELVGHPIELGDLLPFNHPPLLLPLQALVARTEYVTAYWGWVLLMVCFLVLAGLAVDRLYQLEEGMKKAHVGEVIAVLLFYPVFISLVKGQDTAFLLLGGMLWLFGLVSGKEAWAGAGLAMLTIRPQLALALGLPFIFKRQKVLGWAALLGCLHLACFALLGPGGIKQYLQMLMISSQGEVFIINRAAMFNLSGILTRLLPGLSASLLQGTSWGAYLLGMAGLCLLWMRSKRLATWQIALAVVVSLFTSPHLHYHDLALLLVPLVGLIWSSQGQKRLAPVWRTLLPLTLSLVLLLSDLWDPARYSLPYLIMAGLVIWSGWLAGKQPRLRDAKHA